MMFLSSCASYTCPARDEFTGKTYGDLVSYTGTLERTYDSCAEEKRNKDIMERLKNWDWQTPATSTQANHNITTRNY